MPNREQMSAEMERCIQRCTECRNVCLETAAHCLRVGGEHAAADHVGLLMDCAEICATSAKFMLSGSAFHTRTCAVCAEICEACAADCERMADGDRTMQLCAESCRACAATCHDMAGALAY